MNTIQKNINSFKLILISVVMLSMTVLLSSVIVGFKTYNETAIFIMSWVGNIILIWSLKIYYSYERTSLNQYSLFMICLYIFSYGQMFLYSIGIRYESFDLISMYPNKDIVQYLIYYCNGMLFFLIGQIIVIGRKRYYISNNEINFNDKTLTYCVKVTALLMLIVSTPIYLGELFKLVDISVRSGYSKIYEVESSGTGITSLLSMMYIPSLLLLLNVYRKKKLLRNVCLLGLVIPTIAYLVIGTRSRPIAIIIATLFLWNASIKPFTKKEKNFLIILGIIILLSLSIISDYRGVIDKSIQGFFESIMNSSSFTDILVDSIGEMGGSMQIWLRLNRIMPTIYSFKYGWSYIASILCVLPSFFYGGYSFAKDAALATWLTNVENSNYGLGFSIVGEMYYNFGWIGIIMMLFLGIFLTKLLAFNGYKKNFKSYTNSFIAIVLFTFATLGRGSMHLTIRQIVYTVVLPIFLISIIYTAKKR